jgi:membrane protease YdiL (CAAX protease family)
VTAGTLIRLAVELLVLLALCLVLRARGESLREVFALVPIPGATLAGWSAAFALLVAVEALLAPILGLPPVRPWEGHYAETGIVIRLVGIVLLAPVVEELIFRGAAFTRLARTGLEASGAIAVTAANFANHHLQYGSGAVMMILVDGLFYGLARAKTGSVLVPLLCHMLGNSYAAWERLAG